MNLTEWLRKRQESPAEREINMSVEWIDRTSKALGTKLSEHNIVFDPSDLIFEEIYSDPSGTHWRYSLLQNDREWSFSVTHYGAIYDHNCLIQSPIGGVISPLDVDW